MGVGSHSGCGLEFQEKKPGSLKMESLRPGSGRVRVSGADFFLGRSFGTVRNSGASVESGVEGALLGPPRAQDGNGVSEMEMAGGNVPILRLVASWVARSYSLTSSMVMSVGMETHWWVSDTFMKYTVEGRFQLPPLINRLQIIKELYLYPFQGCKQFVCS